MEFITLKNNGYELTLTLKLVNYLENHLMEKRRLALVVREIEQLTGWKRKHVEYFLQRHTPGKLAFNSKLALFLQDGVYVQYNPSLNFTPEQAFPVGRPAPKGVKVKKARSKFMLRESLLNLPENYKETTEDVNLVIDIAYRLLGFNPHKLSKSAPDLNYYDAMEVIGIQAEK